MPQHQHVSKAYYAMVQPISNIHADSLISILAYPMAEAPFPTQFRQARQGKQLTQAAVAEALDVSQSAVAQWESGRSFPSAGLAARIEKLLGIDRRLVEKGQQPQTRRSLGKRARLPIVGLPVPGDEERIIIDGSVRGEGTAGKPPGEDEGSPDGFLLNPHQRSMAGDLQMG
jgi:transcriptional regulator with XRE-family HTH domain